MALQRRQSVVESGAPVPKDPSRDAFAKRWPSVWEFVTSEWWIPGQESRVPGSLLLFLQDGLVKVRLKDNERQEVLFLTGQGIEEVLRLAEEALATGKGEWRPDKWDPKATGRRR